MSNNQEMQFADPAWEPRKTQEFNQQEEMPPLQVGDFPASGPAPFGPANATQQADETENIYAQGYRAQTTFGSEQAKASQPGSQQQSYYQAPPQNQSRRVPPWVWVVVCIVALSGLGKPAFSDGGVFGALFSLVSTALVIGVIWLLVSRRVTVNLSGEKQSPETRTFTVGAHPTILINNKAGSIRLHAGQAGQVNMTTIKRGYLFNQRWNRDAQIWYNQDSAANTVSARVDGWKLFGNNAIDFDITVPEQADLELVTNVGSIHVTNIDGRVKLRSDAGSIHATQVTLQGKSSLKTDAGSITFAGSFSPTGNYELSTDLGNIKATVPLDASLYLDAKTDVGSVNTNLPLAQQQRTKLYGPIGPGPHPHLKLRTDVGSINVERQ